MTEENENWLNEELGQQSTHTDYEQLPSLKLTPNVVVELIIDFSKPFEKWSGEQAGKTIVKKIIPVTVNGTKMNWWVNVANPIYREILALGVAGINTVKVLQTGTQANTRYVIVK
ncbi:MAG: hypothetical protein EOL97_11745 [Spirochaetia bacterium]|nr:hypothetical protein [Spirochaetia bacterium]